MQEVQENSNYTSGQKSSGLIRGAIIGAVLLLAIFGVISAVSKLSNGAEAKIDNSTDLNITLDERRQFEILSTEWVQAKSSLKIAKQAHVDLASKLSKARARKLTQATTLKELELAYSRAANAVAESADRVKKAEDEVAIYLDDSLERKVSAAAQELEKYTAERKGLEAKYLASLEEVERVRAAVIKLRTASEAANAAADATASVATAADDAQILVDQYEDVVPGQDGSTLLNLRNDFFNEAKAQADSAVRSAKAAAEAADASEGKLEQAENRSGDIQLDVERARAREEYASEELTALADELKKLQRQRSTVQKKAAISKERLRSETTAMENRKQALSVEVMQGEKLQTSTKELEKNLAEQEAKVGAAQQIYNDAEAKLRNAQKIRAKKHAASIAVVNSRMHDSLRATLGNLRIENPKHDRFIVPSGQLFESGSAKLGDNGKNLIQNISKVVSDVTKQLSNDTDWMLRVDGHTDATPLKGTGSFKDNWELSQARALSVVKYLIAQGEIPADRLAANGLGEYQPLMLGNNEEAKAENRRIELVLVPR